jgi:hypothetical protein
MGDGDNVGELHIPDKTSQKGMGGRSHDKIIYVNDGQEETRGRTRPEKTRVGSTAMVTTNEQMVAYMVIKRTGTGGKTVHSLPELPNDRGPASDKRRDGDKHL